MRLTSSTEWTVADRGDGLLIRTQRTYTVFERAVVATILALCIGAFARWFLHVGWQGLGLGMLIGALAYVLGDNTQSHQLLVKDAYLESIGKISGQFGKKRLVEVNDLIRLEYQESRSGGDTDGPPEGLYAVVRRPKPWPEALRERSICILPGLDESDVRRPLAQIRERFPGLV